MLTVFCLIERTERNPVFSKLLARKKVDKFLFPFPYKFLKRTNYKLLSV